MPLRLRFHTYNELLTADFLPPAPDIDPETNTYPRLQGEAKVVPEDKAVVRNVTGYIMGIPIVYLPVYVFSVKQGRQSGLTVPNYGSGVEEGRYLRNLGYYWAPNEYFDMKTTADIEAKTGFLLRQRIQYRQDRRLRASARIGRPASKTSSRARLGFSGSGVIVPKTTDSISSGSMPLRSSMPRVAWTAMTRESISAKALPDLMKGVRPPATRATRLGVMRGAFRG